MHFQTVVFVLVLVALPATLADEVHCDKAAFHETLSRIRSNLQAIKSGKPQNSLLATDVAKSAVAFFKRTKALTDLCAPEEQAQFSYLMAFVGGVLAGDMDFSAFSFGNVKNVGMREGILSLICAFDCNIVFEFVEGFDDADSKAVVYEHLLNLMQNTQLNNTELVTSVQFVKDLNTLAAKQTDTTEYSQLLQRLVRAAIKTDMILRHDNLEALYELNHDATAAVVQEIICNYTNTDFKTEDDVEEFPLFEILKCTTKKELWVQHLEMVYNKLHENNKVNTVYTLMLLKQLKTLENLVDGDLKQKVLDYQENSV